MNPDRSDTGYPERLSRAAVDLLDILIEHRSVDWTSASTCASVMPMTGTIVVRCPEGLHQQLSSLAADQGVSLNQLCVALLAGGIGFTLEEEQ